jgi:hypothetical protein
MTPVRITFSFYRGESLLGQQAICIAANARRILPMERLFDFAIEAGDRVTFVAPHRVVLHGYDVNDWSGARYVRPATPMTEAGQPRRRAVRFTTAILTQTVVLTPSKDNTLFEISNGTLSNGKGDHLFAGMTGAFERRRALLAFDLATRIPPGSHITQASLKMNISQTIAGPTPMKLHRVTTNWGEGASNAGSNRDGGGAAAQPGDATWIHTFHPAQFWTNPGGDFAPEPDALTNAGGEPFTWTSSATLIARIQQWLDQPATNFGWIILGDESTRVTAKRFDSREIQFTETRPALTITFVR